VLAPVLEHHPDGSLLHLRRVALHCLLGFHGPILSRVGASGKPGAVQRATSLMVTQQGKGAPA
jgi:hypothetical protein